MIQKRNNTSLVHRSVTSCFIRTWQIYSSGDNGLGFEPEKKLIAGVVFIFKFKFQVQVSSFICHIHDYTETV